MIISLVMAPVRAGSKERDRADDSRCPNQCESYSCALPAGCSGLLAVQDRHEKTQLFHRNLPPLQVLSNTGMIPIISFSQLIGMESTGIFFSLFNALCATDKNREQSSQWHFDTRLCIFSFWCILCSNTGKRGTHIYRPNQKSEIRTVQKKLFCSKILDLVNQVPLFQKRIFFLTVHWGILLGILFL